MLKKFTDFLKRNVLEEYFKVTAKVYENKKAKLLVVQVHIFKFLTGLVFTNAAIQASNKQTVA